MLGTTACIPSLTGEDVGKMLTCRSMMMKLISICFTQRGSVASGFRTGYLSFLTFITSARFIVSVDLTIISLTELAQRSEKRVLDGSTL